MKKPALLPFATLLLCSLAAQAESASTPASVEHTPPALQARIARVEQGLSTRVVVKGSAQRKMALTQRMAFHQVPAVSIALINDGRVEWARAYGMADSASQRPATASTLFQAASVSKPVSALGALRLVEQGKLALDGDANRQLDAWKIPQNEFTRQTPVSLRMLLNHSAGTTVHGYMGYAQGQKLPTLLQILDGVAPANSAPVRVDIAPHSAWRYSGGGYSIVQLMMSEASAQPFDVYMKSAVLDPLGMVHSTFAVPLPQNLRKQAATAYDGSGRAIAGQWHDYPESAAAGLWTTPGDLANVVLDVQRSEAGKPSGILSRNMTTAMLTRGLGEYGLGFFVERLGDRTSFGHSGGTAGFRAQLYGYTRTGQGVVVMTNSDNGTALIDEILCSIAAEYGWPEFGVVEKAAIAGDAAVNQQLAGDYQLANQPAHIVADGERLYFQGDMFGAQRMELFAESKNAFFMTAQDMAIRFERDGDGAVVGFALTRGANTYPAAKTR
ncbi:CubicO group peptidase (beta-lactamase class C family) [Tahibacter aquaticus]|uniref:CubicO group peptidase (Beta-lactamase class C family) n=1 Tax=Tahibacter aquaticus TaxID=520092 RepID=A0A4R6YSN3_9GAMM|nr:serine hydrolase domain-containing protein [Tahibacter aquaticus]TDR41127.1 CubicO group peptidase (beta-lactamase class C family) [Tahibacter aquaticus]